MFEGPTPPSFVYYTVHTSYSVWQRCRRFTPIHCFFFHFPLRALRQSELERGDVVTPETSADAVATVGGLAADAAAGSTKRSKKKKSRGMQRQGALCKAAYLTPRCL